MRRQSTAPFAVFWISACFCRYVIHYFFNMVMWVCRISIFGWVYWFSHATNFSAFICFTFQKSSCLDLYVYIPTIYKTLFTETFSLEQRRKVVFEVCCAETTKRISVRYQKNARLDSVEKTLFLNNLRRWIFYTSVQFSNCCSVMIVYYSLTTALNDRTINSVVYQRCATGLFIYTQSSDFSTISPIHLSLSL